MTLKFFLILNILRIEYHHNTLDKNNQNILEYLCSLIESLKVSTKFVWQLKYLLGTCLAIKIIHFFPG
uniref:Putative ovule protein n=1 Tax=Solanum chacoense TaxID=4108 RepID=A0A0V0GNU8_SOLCH